MDDITDTLAPKTDQLDNIDLASGPRTFTVDSVDVHKGSDQPVVVHLVEFDRPWKPAVTMRRVLATCWGVKSSGWVGNRVELYREPDVTYGKETPGGTRISRLSGITNSTDVDVMLTRGRMGKYRVEPLTDEPENRSEPVDQPTSERVAACIDPSELRRWWKLSGDEIRTLIEARVAELTTEPELDPDDDHAGDIAAMNAENEAN